MTNPTMTDDITITVDKIPQSGICGNVNSSSQTAVPSAMRKETGCSREAEYQAYAADVDPDSVDIVSACDEHVEEAEQFAFKLEGERRRLEGDE